MATQRSLAGVNLAFESVVVVGQELLSGGYVDFALVFLHQLQPAFMPRILAQAGVIDIETRLFLDQFGVGGEIGTNEKAVPGAQQRSVLEAQFQAGGLIVLAVGHQPVVGVAAGVAVPHNAREIVNGIGILHGLAGADEFGNSVGVEAVEFADGGFG